MVNSTVLGLLALFLSLSTSCGDPKSKSERTEVNSEDAIDEDIVAEIPAVISGSHLFCSEEPGVMGDLVDVVCSIKEDVDFEKYVDKDHLVIEVAGKVVPITIDKKGKFKFSLPKGEKFSTESIEVHDIEETKSDQESERDPAKEDEMSSDKDRDENNRSQDSDTLEASDDGDSEGGTENDKEELSEEEQSDDVNDEEEVDDDDEKEKKGKDKKSKDDDDDDDDD